MKERPILFAGSMVRAILEGRKTQTRRALKKQPLDVIVNKPVATGGWVAKLEDNPPRGKVLVCRYGMPGDRLWVKTTWYHHVPPPTNPVNETAWDEFTKVARWPTGETIVDCTPETDHPRWKKRPSIHMPRWASRITLEIVRVRVERLQEISKLDAEAEGIRSTKLFCGVTVTHLEDYPTPNIGDEDPRTAFRFLWDQTYAKRSQGWDANPWVWVIEFRRVP